MNPTVNELKVYVPAKDFELSKKFYTALGFDLTEAWGGNVDCRLGPTMFRLQNYYVEDWANNFMLQFQVNDARGWYEFVKPIIASGNYAPAQVTPPSTHDGALITHVHDPSGVLLIFIE